MADFLAQLAVSGGNSAFATALMGSGAMADTVIDGKKRGLSDGQAFTLGVIAGVVEGVTEKFSIEALLNKTTLGKSALGYFLKNTIAEGAEEGASNILNTVADVLISRDKSEWQTAINTYMAEGFSEEEAFYKALGDQAVSLGLDVLGGAISGSVMATPGVAYKGVQTAAGKYAESVEKKQSMDKPNVSLREESTDRFEPQVETDGSYEDENRNTVRTDGTKTTVGGKIIAPTADTIEQGKRMKAAKTDTARTGIAAGATDGQIKTAERLSRILKKDIRFYREGADENGNIENGFNRDGVLYVNSVGAKTVKWVVGHELTHSAELSAEYGNLQTHVLDLMRRSGKDVDAMVRETMKLYESHGAPLKDENEAKQEIVSDYVANYLFTNERAIRELVRGRPSLGQRILNWIDGFLASAGDEKAEERVMLQKARGLYAAALRDADAVKNNANAGKITETAARAETSAETENAADRFRLTPEDLRAEERGTLPTDDEVDIEPAALDASIREHHPDAKFSVSRAAGENERILSDLRSILQKGGSADDLRAYVNTLDAQERAQATKKPQGTNTQRREDAASQIVRAAHRAGMSVEEYLRENAELYETEDGWNSDARRALQREGERYSISPAFVSKINEWDKDGRPDGELFILGETGEVLQGLGAMEQDIYLNSGKINAILSDHPEMTLSEIKRIPEILDDPVLILKSSNFGRKGKKNSRMVIYGTVKAQNGERVMAVLDMQPIEDGLSVDDMQKVNSAYTRSNAENYVRKSDVMFADEKRAIPLLRSIGLQIRPTDLLRHGSVGSISYSGQNVNIEGVPFSEVFGVSDTGKEKLSVSSTKDTETQTPTIAKRDFVHNLTAMFSIPDGLKKKVAEAITTAADMMLDNGRLDEASRRSFFDYLYASGVMTVAADEYYQNIRSAVRGGKLYVPEDVRAEFGDDWNAFRRKAFDAGVILTNDASDGKIDTWNQELAGLFPGSFSAENTDMRDMLESIVSLAEKGKSEKISLAEYAARAADENFISEKEYMFDMERRFDEELRLFAEKAKLETKLRDKQGAANQAKAQLQKERERFEEGWKKHREQLAAQREQKQMRELQQKTLKALQWLSSNRNRAPEDLRAKYEEVLADIDIYAVGAANEMRLDKKYGATWRDLYRMYKEAQENDKNFFPSKELDKIVMRLDNEKIGDMDINALRDLYQAAVALRTEFYNRNNVLGEMNYQLFDDLYITVSEEMESAPKPKNDPSFFNKAQLSAANFLRRMVGWNPESTFYQMAKQLEDGEYAAHRFEMDARKEIDEFAKKRGDWVRRADGQGKDGMWITKKVPRLAALRFGEAPVFDGEVEIAMTPMMRVHMCLESKNAENLRHMAGGRTFADRDLYSKGKREEAFAQGEPVRLAPETVKYLLKDMSPEELELAEILHRYYNGYAKREINRVSNILYGYDKAMSREYAPIYTDKNYVKTEPGIYDVTAEGAGNLKSRQHSGNPSYQIGAMDAFDRHVDRTAKFVGLAIPVRNWTTLLNWREKSDSMRKKISHKWGKEGISYIDQLLTDLQTGSARVTEDDLSTFFGKIYSNTIGSVFGLNPSVVAKQLGSVVMAGAELDYNNMPKAKQIASIDRDLIFKYTAELAYRAAGNASAEMQIMRNNPNWTQRNKAARFATGGAITEMDQWTASVLWPWAENKVRREHPGVEKGTDAQIQAGESAFYKKVAEEFNNAVSHSQSISDEMHQGTLRKSKNTISRTFTMFKSDAAQGYNQLRKNIGEAQYYERQSKNKSLSESARKEAAEKAERSKRKVGAAVIGILLNNSWAATVTFLAALLKNRGKKYRDDEDEITIGSFMKQWSGDVFTGIAGMVTLGEELTEFLGNLLTGEQWYDIEAPGVDVVNDLFKLVGDAGGGAMDFFSRGMNVLRDGGDVGKFLAQNAGEIVGGLKDTAVSVSSYFGIPAKNLETYLLGVFQWVAPGVATAYEDLLDSPEKADLAGLKGKALDRRVADIMKERGVTLDKDASDTLAAIYDAGEKGVIPSNVPSSFTAEGESYTLTETQKQRYSAAWSETVNKHLQNLLYSKEFRQSDFEDKVFMIEKVYKLGAEYAKQKVVPEYEVAKWAEEVSAFEKEKLNVPKYLEAQAVYTKIYDTEEDAKTKALEFARWVVEQEFTSAQREVVRECFGHSAENYYKFIDAGVSEYGAYRTAKAIAELKPVAGKDSVSAIQKYRAVVNELLPETEEMAALSQVMSESEYAKVEAGSAHGITPGVYVTFKELLPQYDEDGNGSYSQEEVENAIDDIGPRFGIAAPSYGSANAKNANLTNAQRAVLWQLANKSWKPESNPYSVYVGRKVYNDLNQ